MKMDETAKTTDDFFSLSALHKRIGVSLSDVIGNRKAIPEGYVFDSRTYYYVPPNIAHISEHHKDL